MARALRRRSASRASRTWSRRSSGEVAGYAYASLYRTAAGLSVHARGLGLRAPGRSRRAASGRALLRAPDRGVRAPRLPPAHRRDRRQRQRRLDRACTRRAASRMTGTFRADRLQARPLGGHRAHATADRRPAITTLPGSAGSCGVAAAVSVASGSHPRPTTPSPTSSPGAWRSRPGPSPTASTTPRSSWRFRKWSEIGARRRPRARRASRPRGSPPATAWRSCCATAASGSRSTRARTRRAWSWCRSTSTTGPTTSPTSSNDAGVQRAAGRGRGAREAAARGRERSSRACSASSR